MLFEEKCLRIDKRFGFFFQEEPPSSRLSAVASRQTRKQERQSRTDGEKGFWVSEDAPRY